LLKEAENKEKV